MELVDQNNIFTAIDGKHIAGHSTDGMLYDRIMTMTMPNESNGPVRVSPVISKIISMQASLTMREGEIAQYVIQHPDKVVNSTITNIAKHTGTSEASINRFCKKVGYKGFNGFKIALAQETFYNTIQGQNNASQEDSTISSIMHDYVNMLISTSAMQDDDVLEAAIEALQEAENIYVLSFESTLVVAQDFIFKLGLIGIHAIDVHLQSNIQTFSSSVSEKDTVIVIVPTILLKDIYRAVTSCKDRGAKILAVTSYDSPKLNNIVDCKFVTCDKITAKNSLGLSNNLVFLYVMDVIYCALLQKNRNLQQKKLAVDAVLNDQVHIEHYMLEY